VSDTASPHARLAADESAQRLVATVHGTIVGASVLAVSGGVDDALTPIEASVYVLATVVVFWVAHAWGHLLGFRAAGVEGHGVRECLRDQVPIVEAAVAPVAALLIAGAAGASDDDAITIAIWICVGQLALLGVGVGRREGQPPHRIALTAAGCAALGVVMVALKAIVH
jgi:hypothetical protein